MKRIFTAVMALLLTVCALAGCSREADEYESAALDARADFKYSSYTAKITFEAFTEKQTVVSLVVSPERQVVLIESEGKCVYYDSGIEKTCVKIDESGKAVSPTETVSQKSLESYDFYKYLTESEHFVRNLHYTSAKRSYRSIDNANGTRTAELKYIFREHSFSLGGNLSVMFFLKQADRSLTTVSLTTYFDESSKGRDMINIEYYADASKLSAKYRTLESVYNKFVGN